MEYESDYTLFSDYERLSYLLNQAMLLSLECNNFNPIIIRPYFAILKDVWRFLKPALKEKIKKEEIELKIKKLDKQSLAYHLILIKEKNSQIPINIFLELDSLYDELTQLKYDLNLSVKVRKSRTETEKVREGLDLESELNEY